MLVDPRLGSFSARSTCRFTLWFGISPYSITHWNWALCFPPIRMTLFFTIFTRSSLSLPWWNIVVCSRNCICPSFNNVMQTLPSTSVPKCLFHFEIFSKLIQPMEHISCFSQYLLIGISIEGCFEESVRCEFRAILDSPNFKWLWRGRSKVDRWELVHMKNHILESKREDCLMFGQFIFYEKNHCQTRKHRSS